MFVKRRWSIAILSAFLAILWSASAILGQPAADTISGLVQDEHGPLAGAIVRAQNTPIQTLSAEDGTFTLTGLSGQQALTITAAAKGYYIRWSQAQPGDQDVIITVERHPLADNNEGYTWQSASACGECHTAFTEWQQDAHAQSATNPRFLSMYQGTDVHGNKSPLTELTVAGNYKPVDLSQPYFGPGFRLDSPNRMGNCAACHTPMASTLETSNSCGWSGCHTDFTTEYSDQIPPAVNPTGLKGVALEGINCDFCHKIGKVLLDEESGKPDTEKPGILSLSIYRPPAGEELLFGTVVDVARTADSYLPIQAESAFCAACHYGAITRTVIYNSFGEWLDSPYSDPESGKSCQDCHMPALPAADERLFPKADPNSIYFVFPAKGGLAGRDPNQIHNHTMAGGSDKTFLQNTVTMTATATLLGDEVQVAVQIKNDKAGHHVPTDSPLRQVILLVQARDSEGKVLPVREGPLLPAWSGDLAGQPGRAYARIFEDIFSGEAPTFAHWRQIALVEDTRIAALATDSSQYRFAAPPAGSITVEAKLLYRRAFQQLQEWKAWDDPDILMEYETLRLERPLVAPQGVTGAKE
jgi:hypothetical protein